MSEKTPLEKSISERMEHERYKKAQSKKEPFRFNIQMLLVISITIGLILILIRVWQMLGN